MTKQTENEEENVVRKQIKAERESLVEQLENWLETPLLILGFVWLILLVIELTGNLSPALELFGTIIWTIFILNYIKDFVEVDRHKTKAAKNFYYDYQLVFENLLAVRALLERVESIDKKSFRIYHGGLPSGETLADQHSYHFTLKDVFSFNASEGINSPNYSSLINVEILPDSTMNLTLSPLLYAISKADTRRIRQCRFCRKFFWAERYDALGCSPRCSNALRQRKLRESRMTPIE